MFCKWIVCNVRGELRDSFALAQTKWIELATIPGFVGQLGGWDLKSKNDACILGIWQNQESYQVFMDQYHDKIVSHNEQGDTFETIDVSLLQPISDMPGVHDKMTNCIEAAKIIRVADCFVRPEREEHFIEVQETIWIPAMSQAPGMLAGSFNKVLGDSIRYIVTTSWVTEEAHENYVHNTLPSLRAAASVSEDVQQITGRLISTVRDWLVTPAVG